MEKKYRVEYTDVEIVQIMEDGEFFTASPNYLISGTKEKIKTMLESIGVDCSKLNEVE